MRENIRYVDVAAMQLARRARLQQVESDMDRQIRLANRSFWWLILTCLSGSAILASGITWGWW